MPGILEPTGNGSGHGPSNHFVPIEDSALFTETPVLIVGGGPTGLLSAYMLSRLGIKSILIEKYPERLEAPKAHALSPRSLEICRQFGLDTNLLRTIGTPRDEAYWVNFLVNLSRERIGTLPYERMDAAVLDCTPEMIHNIPQPKFEQFIADQLQNDPNVILRKNVAFIKCSQTLKDITCIVEERSTKIRWKIKSRHLLACDGARSEVRKDLAIESEGEDGYETMMTIHFEANLAPIVRERLGMLHWITDPACSGFIITYDLRGDHVLISNFDSEKHKAESWTQQLARSTVSAAIGQDVPFEVKSFRPWVLSRKVAKHYRQGRAFLIGDAAHSFPPTGGLGLNSGIADAHNIAFKLAAVHYGWARSSILDSFEGDRRQVALVNSAQSVKNGKQIFSFLKSLGTAGVKDEQEARENLHRSVHDPRMRGKIAEEVEAQREHFDNLELHIGYVYGDNRTPPNASKFSPKFVPGARLPHAWIIPTASSAALDMPSIDLSYVKELRPIDVETRRYSTLDLIKVDTFTLVASSNTWDSKFGEACQLIHPKPVRVMLVAASREFHFACGNAGRRYELDSGLAEGGALLVRPDQHLLACFDRMGTAHDIANSIVRYLCW